ncbi:ArsR/SmtB family transcription factor [Ferruginibacter sp.]
MDIKQVEKISKALADTTRLQILKDMYKRKGCIQCSEIMNITNLAQPSVSHHIKTLIEAGLIDAEKDGRNHSYNLNQTVLKAYASWINNVAG